MRNLSFAPSEYYHIVGRGHGHSKIFLSNSDYLRFLFPVLFFQSLSSFDNIGRLVKELSSSGHNLPEVETLAISERAVKLICFALMPNHYHLLLRANRENGVSKYMQRVLTAYSKYYNTRYNKKDHVFSGPFRAVHIDSNEQLLYTSAYIHRNPIELGIDYETYPWSSMPDYIGSNRWGKLLSPTDLQEQFDSETEYAEFVKTNPSKEPVE